MNIWSKEMAEGIEGDLIRILSIVPTVLNVRGSSLELYEDFKVVFEHDESAQNTYFLKLMPESEMLVAWAGGLFKHFPEDVREYLTQAFPDSNYLLDKGIAEDGFHQWHNVTEMDLRRAVSAGN